MEVICLENILGARLRSLRESRNLTQKRVSSVFGITNFQLSRYESGQSNPDPDLIAKFAEFYEVPSDYLLGLVDSPKSLKASKNADSDDNIFYFDLEGLSEEDKKEIDKYIELLKLRAKQFNEDSKKNN